MGYPHFVPVTSDPLIQQTTDLAYEIWTTHFPGIISQAQIDYMLNTLQSKTAIQEQIQAGFRYYLIQVEGYLAGYLAVKPEQQQKQLFLSKLYILKQARGTGLARRSIEFIETLACEMNLSRIYLTCNKYNTTTLDIYAHLGFKTVDSVKKKIGSGFIMDDYVLKKTVDPKL